MKSHWNFLTNYGHVLMCLAKKPSSTLREIAELVGITERTTARIVKELVGEGALRQTRRGRCNHYEIQLDFPLRHSLEKHCSVGQLIDMVAAGADDAPVQRRR